MNPSIIYQNESLKLNKRNPKSSLLSKKLFLKEKLKNNSFKRVLSTTPNKIKQFPILSFPLSIKNNRKKSSSLFLTSTNFSKSEKIFKTIMVNSTYRNKYKYTIDFNNNKSTKKISHSRFTKPVIVGKTIENKLKESKKMQQLKRINILDFGNNLKLYDEIEQKQKEKAILDKRTKQLDEIYYDYDKRNRKKIMNSFSGNSADLLRNKVIFVKGIIDYLYPKLV